jgi:hypothetical protein
MGYKISQRADNLIIKAEEDYLCRLNKSLHKEQVTHKELNLCRNQPLNAIRFLNFMMKRCETCKKLYPERYIKITPDHLRRYHNVNIRSIDEIINYSTELERNMKLKCTLDRTRLNKTVRNQIHKELESIYEKQINIMKAFHA